MTQNNTPICLLHLEDSDRDAALIRDVLDATGGAYEFIRAVDQKQFEKALNHSEADLIICDFNLPDYDGLSALKLAKAKSPNTPTIIVSKAFNFEEAEQKAEGSVQYWRKHIATAPHFNPDCECFAVLLLNVRQRIRGHYLVSIGSLNEAMAHPREVFRAPVIGASWGVVLMHDHPSGDPSISDADIRMTRRLTVCGRTLQITVCDHVIIGTTQHLSLRETGIIQ